MGGNMKTIPLTEGKVALVDDADYDRVAAFKWRAYWYNCIAGWYAVRPHNILMHRFILDAPKGTYVDHIDHDGLNNTRANIRLCSKSQNQWNHKKHGNRQPYKGVFSRPEHKDHPHPWQARITCRYKTHYLGSFTTAEEAAEAYNRAAIHYFGEFAYLNKIAL